MSAHKSRRFARQKGLLGIYGFLYKTRSFYTLLSVTFSFGLNYLILPCTVISYLKSALLVAKMRRVMCKNVLPKFR